MIRALSSLIAIGMVVPISGHTTEASVFVSPCPNVFTYEPPGTDPGKWYGIVKLNTDTTLYALWLNVVLESKADILGNWVGEVTTDDNIDFKIENTKLKIDPGATLSVRFFIQYNSQSNPPKLRAIRFNGREICNVENVTPVRSDLDVRAPNTSTSNTLRPTVTTSRSTDGRQTTSKPQYSIQTKVANTYQVKSEDRQQTTTVRPYWTQAKTENNYQLKSDNRQQTTLKPQYWQQTKVDNTHQVKSEDKQQTSLKPQYWTQSKVEDTTKTYSSTQIWPHNTFETTNNNQQITDSKFKAQPDDRAQITTVDKVQATTQFWSQNTVANNQQTRTQDRNNNTEEKQQIKLGNTSKSIPENLYEQQTGLEATTQTKYDDKLKTKIENKSHTTAKPSLWQQVKEAGNQYVHLYDSHLIKTENKSQTDLKQIRPDITIVEDILKIKSESVIGIDGVSHLIPDSSQQIRPDNRYQSNLNEMLQSRPTDFTYKSPLYIRPGSNEDVSTNSDTTQTKLEETNRRKTEYGQQTWNEERLELVPIKNQEKLTEHRQKWSQEKTSSWSGNTRQSWSEEDQSKDRVVFESAGESSSYDDYGRIKNLDSIVLGGYQATTARPTAATTKTPQMDDFDDNRKKQKHEEIGGYFGGLPTIYIPNHPPQKTEPQCGRVLLKKPVSYIQSGSSTAEGQWPWQIALYQQQTTVDFKYICGGTLVSPRHIITAAHCVTRKGSRRLVNKNTLTVYLGKYNLRTSVDGVQVKFVNKIILHPEYNATTFSRDVAILELRESVVYSNWVQPACLWPEDEIDLKNIIGKKGSVVGWGFEVTGVAREELSLLEMPVVDQDTCIRSYIEFYKRFTSDYTYCAGYKDGTSVCNGDSGGGMVFKKGNNWYLRGLASLSVARQGEYRCDPRHYVIFTDLAKLLPWIDEHVDDY